MPDIFDKVSTKPDVFDTVSSGKDVFDSVETDEERAKKYGAITAEPKKSWYKKAGEFVWEDVLPTQYLTKGGRELARAGVNQKGEPVGEADVAVGQFMKGVDLGTGGGTLFGVGKSVIKKSAKEVAETTAKQTGKKVFNKAQQEVLKEEEELPKYASSVNLEKQAIDDSAKRLEVEAGKKVPKKTQTWDETGKLSNELRKDYSALKGTIEKAHKGEALTAVEIDAVRQYNVDALASLKNAAKLEPEEFNKVFQTYTDGIFKATTQASSEAGRALNIHKKVVAPTRMAKAFSKLGRELNERELNEFKDLDLSDPSAVDGFINRLGDPKLKDYVYEYWYNAILSGPPTHVVNIASNTSWQMFQVPHRALTAGIDKIFSSFTGKQRTRFVNEVIPMMAGYKSGFKRGAQSAKDMFRVGKVTDYETKWAKEVGNAMGAFERSPNKAIRKMAPYLTVPTKALRAMDVWANSMAYDAQLNALAKRASKLKGLTGQEARAFERNFVENVSEEAHQEAMKFAKYSTFMDDPGEFAKLILKIREHIPGGRFLVPFVTTIGNLMKRGLEMTPGVGLAPQLSKGQNAAEIAAKQLEGAMLTMLVWGKYVDGEITGAAPEKPAEREAFYRQGKQAWAIKIGDNWHQYRRMEPFNTVIASATIAFDKLSDPEVDEETKTEAVIDAVGSFKNNLIDSSYLQGISQVFNRHGSAKGAIQRLGASFIPYSGFLRSMARSYEVATEGSAKLRERDSWLAAFGTTIPGLSKNVPTKLDVWGKEIELEGGMFRQWLPYKWSKEVDDPVENAFEKLDVYPAHPSQKYTLGGEEKEFDDDIYRDFIVYYGNTAKKALDESIPHLQDLIDNPETHATAKKIIDRIMTKNRNAARKRAIGKQLEREEQQWRGQ